MTAFLAILLLLLLLCSAFFSSAETALFALNPIQVTQIGQTRPKSGRRLAQMLKEPATLLSAILMGNTLVNVAAAAVGYTLIRSLVVAHAELISIVAMTSVLLVFGELAPKRTALNRSEQVSILYAPVLAGLIWVTTPPRVVLRWLTRGFDKHIEPSDRALTEQEFLSVIGLSHEEGVLDEEERTMVDGIIRLGDQQACDVMTPRVDLEGIDLEDELPTHEEILRMAGYRHLPLYRDKLDQIEAFLDVRAYLVDPDHSLEAATIPGFHVPETLTLAKLLATMQRDGQRVAIVTDEFGGTAGLVTLGDILEEIVDDVADDELPPIQPIGKNRWLVDGSASLEDINYELNMELDEEGVDRISGWVTAQAEHLPKPGKVVEAQGCRATVQRVRTHRITNVILERLDGGNGSDRNGE